MQTFYEFVFSYKDEFESNQILLEAIKLRLPITAVFEYDIVGYYNFDYIVDMARRCENSTELFEYHLDERKYVIWLRKIKIEKLLKKDEDSIKKN